MNTTLEREFLDFEFLHKCAIVKAILMKIYQYEHDTGVNLPDFLDSTVEEKAQNQLNRLLQNKFAFEKAYNSAWDAVKEDLP